MEGASPHPCGGFSIVSPLVTNNNPETMTESNGQSLRASKKKIQIAYWATLLLVLFGFISIVTNSWVKAFDAPQVVWLNPFALTSIVLGYLFGPAFFDSFWFSLLSWIMALWPAWFLMAYSAHRALK